VLQPPTWGVPILVAFYDMQWDYSIPGHHTGIMSKSLLKNKEPATNELHKTAAQVCRFRMRYWKQILLFFFTHM